MSSDRRCDPTVCSVCDARFTTEEGENEPKILPCQHTVCNACVVEATEVLIGLQSYYECPSCRTKFQNPESLPSNDLALGLLGLGSPRAAAGTRKRKSLDNAVGPGRGSSDEPQLKKEPPDLKMQVVDEEQQPKQEQQIQSQEQQLAAKEEARKSLVIQALLTEKGKVVNSLIATEDSLQKKEQALSARIAESAAMLRAKAEPELSALRGALQRDRAFFVKIDSKLKALQERGSEEEKHSQIVSVSPGLGDGTGADAGASAGNGSSSSSSSRNVGISYFGNLKNKYLGGSSSSSTDDGGSSSSTDDGGSSSSKVMTIGDVELHTGTPVVCSGKTCTVENCQGKQASGFHDKATRVRFELSNKTSYACVFNRPGHKLSSGMSSQTIDKKLLPWLCKAYKHWNDAHEKFLSSMDALIVQKESNKKKKEEKKEKKRLSSEHAAKIAGIAAVAEANSGGSSSDGLINENIATTIADADADADAEVEVEVEALKEGVGPDLTNAGDAIVEEMTWNGEL